MSIETDFSSMQNPDWKIGDTTRLIARVGYWLQKFESDIKEIKGDTSAIYDAFGHVKAAHEGLVAEIHALAMRVDHLEKVNKLFLERD